MYWKHKVYICFFWLLMVAQPIYAKDLIASLRELLSFKLSKDIFSSINESIIGKLTAKNMRYYLPNKMELDDVTLLDEHGETVLSAKQVELTISLLSLLTNNIRVSDALVKVPFFHYRIVKQVHNVVNLFSSPPSVKIEKPKSAKKKPIRVTIESVRAIDGGYKMFHDAGVKISALGIFAQGSFWVEGGRFSISIKQVDIKNGNILAAGMDLPITNLSGKDLFISDEKVSTPKLTALYEKAKLDASGTVDIEKDLYDITASIDAPKGTYPKGLSPMPLVAPAFKASVIMKGTLTEPELLADIRHLGTEFRGLAIREGFAKVQINPYQVIVNSSTIKVGKSGEISATGTVDISRETYSFTSEQKKVTATELTAFLGFSGDTQGLIDGKISFSGSFAKGKKRLELASQGRITDGQIEQFLLPGLSSFLVKADIIFEKEIRVVEAKLWDDAGLNIRGNGNSDWQNQSYDFSFNLFCPELGRYFGLKRYADSVSALSAQGKLAQKNQVFTLNADVAAKSIEAHKLKATNVTGKIGVVDDHIKLTNTSGDFYDGTFTADIALSWLRENSSVLANVFVKRIDLKHLSNRLSIPVLGLLSGSMEASGKLINPNVRFAGDINRLVVHRAELENCQFEGEYHLYQLNFNKLVAFTQAGSIESAALTIDLKNEAISGHLGAYDVNLESVLFAYHVPIRGRVNGPITIAGTISSPSIEAELFVNQLHLSGVDLGSGPATLSLKKAFLNLEKQTDLVFSISTNLATGDARTSARLAFALNKKTLNADITLDNVELNTQELGFSNPYIAIFGRISGKAQAKGRLYSPDIDAKFTAHEYSFLDPRLRMSLTNDKRRGPAEVTLKNRSGKLSLDACISLKESFDTQICNEESSLLVKLEGPFSIDQFSLDFSGSFDYAHFEEIVFAVKNELITVDSRANFSGRIAKTRGHKPKVVADLTLLKLVASLPNIPQIRLKEPITLVVRDGLIALKEKAILTFFPGQLVVFGSVSHRALNLELNGSIPLVLARFFAPIIQRSDGLASGHITLSGSQAAPLVEGGINFEPGASITLKKWLDPIDIKEGKLIFNKTSKASFLTTFDRIKLAAGDGRIALNGSVRKEYHKEENGRYSALNFSAQGSNVVIRDGHDFVETDFSIETVQMAAEEPIVKVNITLTDGAIHRQFDLRNFVAQARTAGKADFSKFLNTFPMRLDLDLSIRHFRASARMLNLDIDTTLRGDLNAQGPISEPKFTGELSITEGTITFPATVFYLSESQITFDETSKKAFAPKINLVAFSDLEEEDYPRQIKEDTTIEFTLKGDMERLNLDLQPIAGDLRLSKFRIFLLLLSPRTLSFDRHNEREALKRGAQSAALALSGEVFLRPLTNELSELLETQTKTRVQLGSTIEPGGMSLRLTWKLNPRIELQGSYLFASDELKRAGTGASALFTENYPLGELKLMLLLFDHRPLGPLSLETSFGSMKQLEGRNVPRGVFRLKYRVLSQ